MAHPRTIALSQIASHIRQSRAVYLQNLVDEGQDGPQNVVAQSMLDAMKIITDMQGNVGLSPTGRLPSPTPTIAWADRPIVRYAQNLINAQTAKSNPLSMQSDHYPRLWAVVRVEHFIRIVSDDCETQRILRYGVSREFLSTELSVLPVNMTNAAHLAVVSAGTTVRPTSMCSQSSNHPVLEDIRPAHIEAIRIRAHHSTLCICTCCMSGLLHPVHYLHRPHVWSEAGMFGLGAEWAFASGAHTRLY